MLSARVGALSDPRHMSVGPNQNGAGSRDESDCRKLPLTQVFGVDQGDAMARMELCSAADIEEGGALRIEAGGLTLAVFNVGGSFYVTDDHCTRRDARASASS